MAKPAHYRGSYHVQSKKVRDAAYADPATPCWRCGRTLAEHPRHKTGAPAKWTAGHLIDGMRDGPLAPEASTCNYQAGARLGGRRMKEKALRRVLGLQARPPTPAPPHTTARW